MTSVNKVQRVTDTSQVVESVRSAIANGTLRIGDRLPPEDELSERIGVGRSSLREGMRILAAYGVIEVRQGDGTYVINRMAEHFLSFMGFLPTDANLLYALELRRVLEVGNILQICDTITEDEIRQLEEVNRELMAESDYEENIQQDIEFHALLVSFAKNPLLIQINDMIGAMRRETLKKLFQRKGAASGAAEAHVKIIEALRMHDRSKCIEAVEEHLGRTIDDAKAM